MIIVISIIIQHYFREGLITLSLEYFKINQEDALLYNYNHVEQLEMMITRALDAGKGSSLPPIQRCLPRWLLQGSMNFLTDNESNF